ncbi:hypothetical protein EMPG_09297, partial [Blastomyces silverae]
ISDHCCKVFHEYSYNISDYFLSADKVETLSFITVFSSINSSYLIFKSVINSVSISQSVTQSLTLSSAVLLFTISLFINIFILSVLSAAL